MDFQNTDTGASAVLRSLLNNGKKETLLQSDSNIVRDKQAVLSNGRRITLKAKSNSAREQEKDAVNKLVNVKQSENYLDMPLLWEKIRIEERAREETKEFEKQNKELNDSVEELKKYTRNKNTLWTEKYRPRKYIELIGNERVNSNILKWLNDWNYVVKNGKLIDSNTYDRDSNVDPFKRPRKKVLLIHGPPGIGKTTIAQCVCRQLGYEIQEINASDERSGNVVKDKVRNSLKMRSLSGKNVCLLLDEIDGAVGSENGFIRVLISLLNKDHKVTEEWNHFNKLKYNKMEDFIKRPIIAMCNDIGAHCLDQLKPYCEIVSFKRSNNKNIKRKLKMILDNEQVAEFSESLLDDLIISLDGDIRNCINFLQFNSRDLNGRVKDMEVNWFQTLKDVFNLDKKNFNNRKSKAEIFNELKTKLGNSGHSMAKINAGCFNLMLQVNEDYDNALAKINEMSEYLYFEDLVDQNFRLFDNDELNLYRSLLPLKYFQVFTNFNEVKFFDKNRRLNFKAPEQFEFKRDFQRVVGQLSAAYKLAINRKTLVTHEISMLNFIVVPRMLSIKEFERDEDKIRRILAILKELGIRIESGSKRAGRNSDGSGNGYGSGNRARGRYDQIGGVRIHRFNPNIVLGLMGSGQSPEEEAEMGDVNEVRAGLYINVLYDSYNQFQKVDRLKSHNKRAIEGDGDRGDKRKQSAPLSTVDYFKKQYSDFNSQLHKATGKAVATTTRGVMNENDNRIWVKYHEGFSNAVRKEITWQSLFTTTTTAPTRIE